MHFPSSNKHFQNFDFERSLNRDNTKSAGLVVTVSVECHVRVLLQYLIRWCNATLCESSGFWEHLFGFCCTHIDCYQPRRWSAISLNCVTFSSLSYRLCVNFGKSRLSRDSILESEARENNHQKTGGNWEEGRFGTRNQRFNPLHS